MPASLAEIVANKRIEVDQRRLQVPEPSLRETVSKCDSKFLAALSQPGINLVCEIKPKSPSAGTLMADFAVDQILAAYNQYAAALSVLCDQKYFGGSLSLLSQVARQSDLPILCKDFFIDAYQCFEARKAGAHATLLIVKILSDPQLKLLYDSTVELGMTPIVEIQNEEELERALSLTPSVLLINNRNLDTFDIDLQTSVRLIPKIPKRVKVISASGFSDRSHLEIVLPSCQNFLIGSALMQTNDLGAKLRELKGAGGKACSVSPLNEESQ